MNEEFRILVTSRSFGRFFPESLESLRRLGTVDFTQHSRALREVELLNLISRYDAVVAGTDEFTENVIARGAKSRLKIIARHGVGLDNVDLEAARRHKVYVSYTPEANSDSVADHTIALILTLLRKILGASTSLMRGEWEAAEFMGHELKEKLVGVIGFGSIGRRVAKRLEGFDATVGAYDPYVPEEEIERGRIKCLSLEKVLESSDVITLHVKLTPETHRMIGRTEIESMKKNAIIVNTSRGGVIDENALVDALRTRRIAGAALDVFDDEPPPKDHPLLKNAFENVVLTPHIAAYTFEAIKRMGEMVIEDIFKVLHGEKPTHVEE